MYEVEKVIKIYSLIMLIVAVAFSLYAVTLPEFGTTFYIGNLEVGTTILKRLPSQKKIG